MSRLPCPPQHIAQVPEWLLRDRRKRGECMPYTTLPARFCAGDNCPLNPTEEHHAVPKHFTRSWKERDYALLYEEPVRVKVPVCHECHVELTENRAMVVYTPESGFVWTWLTEGERAGDTAELSLAADTGDSATPLSASPSVSPDDTGLTGVGEDRSLGADKSPPASEPDLLADGSSSPIPVSPGQPCPYCGKRGDYPKKLTSPKSWPVSYRVPADEIEEHKRHLKEVAQHLGTYEQPHWQFWTYAFALAEALGNPAIEGAAKR